MQIVGSGQGSVAAQDIRAELPAIAAEITNGGFAVSARPMPLAVVERAWSEATQTSDRIVITPQG